MNTPVIHDPEELRFSVYTVTPDKIVGRMFDGLPLSFAEILSGLDRDEFDLSMMHQGWVGAWLDSHRVVILPEGELIRRPQFEFLMELVG